MKPTQDFGGLNILAQLRKLISPRCLPADAPLHELQAPAGASHPLLVGLDVAAMLRAWSVELTGAAARYLGMGESD